MVVRGVPARRRVCWCWSMLVAVLCAAALAPPATAAAPPVGSSAIGVHSALYLDHPFSAKEAMFKEAAAVGASTIRLDIELSGVFADPTGPPDWSGIDEFTSLARRYHLRVLADLTATPWYAVDCPPGTPPEVSYRCPPKDPARWGADAGVIAAHTRGVIDDFEIINEPDGKWAFLGTPQQYAAILAASYDAIHHANPNAHVALGGLMDPGSGGRAWTNAMLATPGPDATHKFDIANIHVRTPAAVAGPIVAGWRSYLSSKGFTGPLWVTETGYPADRAWQTDPGYRDGAPAQARYLAGAIPAMIRAGAGKVFVTERDSLTGPFTSEGILDSTDPLTANPQYTRRPGFYTVHDLATITLAAPPTTTLIGSPQINAATLILRIACQGNPGQQCAGVAKITTTRKFDSRRRIILGPSDSPRRPSRIKAIPIASAQFTTNVGNTIRLKITLNPTGRKLLATVKRLPATLNIATIHNHTTTTLAPIKVTFKQRPNTPSR